MARKLWRTVASLGFIVSVAACSGGGCGGCGTPIPGGFPSEQTVPNGATVRITRSGLDFMSTNIPTIAGNALGAKNGTYGVDIPHIDPGNQQIADLLVCQMHLDPNVCPSGPNPTSDPPQCHASVGVPTLGTHKMVLHLDAVTPNALQLSGTVPLQIDDTPVTGNINGCLLNFGLTLHIGYGTPVGSGCNNGTPTVSPYDLPISVTIPLVSETLSPRQGFTKIDVNNAVIDLSGIQEQQVQICTNCGAFDTACDVLIGGSCCDAVTNSSTVKNLIVGQLTGSLQNAIKPLLQSQLCQKPNPMVTPSCPTDTKPNADGSACVFNSNPNQCLSMLLGLETHQDLSSTLASISPGSTGALDAMLAAGGAMKPFPNKPADNMPYKGHTPNGVTLGFLGGALPQPQSACVPKALVDIPTDIPTPQLLEGDTVPNWPAGTPGPHADVAIAGRFLNYALGNVYNSGLLCLGVTTEQIAQINSGLVSVLIPSIKKLTFEQKAAGVAITTRPQMPPTVKIGGGTDIKKDPLLTVSIPKFAIDFYIWSDDRFVRAFTFEADVTLPVNLQTGKDPKTNPNGGLLPVLGTLSLANGVVTNNDLLTDDPKLVAGSLTSIIGGLSGQLLGGGFKPIDLSSLASGLGLSLDIPANGIQKVTEGTDDFLTIFANFSDAKSMIATNTNLGVKGKHVDPAALTIAGYDRAKLPTLDIELSSPQDDGKNIVEYSWAIDEGTRSAWSTDKNVTIKDDYLFYQGKHVLRAWSRLQNKMATEDPTPAEAPFTIDTLPPDIEIAKVSDHTFTVDALDYVSEKAALKMRYRAAGAGAGEYSPWASVDPHQVLEVPNRGTAVEVQVGDEEGNIGTISQDLIRGRDDSTLTTAASSCGCQTPGSKGNPGGLAAALAIIGGLIAIVLRRRGARNGVTIAGLGTIAAIASTTQGCACGDSNATGSSGCGSDCNQECQPALPLGLAGAYLSVAKASDGTYWVSGYNDSALSDGVSQLYGDLVVGKYDQGKGSVMWQSVDGLPPARTDGTCPDNDPTGWRHGETDAADDVGLWTSIQIGDSNRPMVSYYDATHGGLKFAVLDNGTWTTHTVKQAAGSDSGRYSKLAIVNGNPVIAFLTIEAGMGGKGRARVTIARSSDPAPKDPSPWTFEDAVVDDGEPCNGITCSGSQVCVKSSGVCQATTTGCTPADCGSGNACVTVMNAASCQATITSTTVFTYPNVFGDYIAMQNGPNGLGLVVYDRIHGNLVALESKGSGTWKQTILDGETGSRTNNTAKDTGDCGIGASLFIAADGTWHVSYVSGDDETVRYVSYKSGGTPSKPEIVDDGMSVDGQAFTDGKHIVGDDSQIQVDDSGTVTIVYQDATAGTLRRATGTSGTTGHKWTTHKLDQTGKFAGFFPSSVDTFIANYWRANDPDTKDTHGDVSFVTP
jgi:hypothetical protein